VQPDDVRASVESSIRARELIAAGGAVTCLVSGGPDSTCLWHALGALGYAVTALHVNHGLRGAESDHDAQFCREEFGAEVVDAGGGTTEDELRRIRYSFATDRLRATGHTRTDQAETVLLNLVQRGTTSGIRVKRPDGVVRPLLDVPSTATRAYCDDLGLPYRLDSSNAATKRGLIRDRILPALAELDANAEANLARAAANPTVSPELAAFLDERAGSKRIDLGSGGTLVREYDRVWVERTPVALDGTVRWGEWRIESDLPGLKVRAWRAGDRLAGRRKKIQDVFVDAKIPRSARESWPLVVRGDEVVAVPGVVDVRGVKAERVVAE
jgi:tRNA(Ile)-lysidine synthetase-like protein